MGQLKILMVDDHAMVREGIRLLLDKHGFDCDLLEAGSCADAVTFLEQHDDVNWVLLDLGLPDKETAEQARAEAEAANQSKSRFRAAASHDLRQPVHALGLFVAAAQQPTTDVERRLIIDRIVGSVRSLAALFDSLLDISRLDAGILQPQIKCVALAPILRKLAAEYLAEAFEEFYQIGNPERDRRNGVGLGLAIVKRIAALLAHRVNLTSRLGRGTRFSIDVPIGAISGDETGQPTPLTYDDETVLFGAVVVIIDDEVDILAAVALLLKQWGCQVIAADCGTQATQKLKAEDAVPDFILSDYRLRDDETGIGVIQALRATYGGGNPALLVTGDTACERLRDATASGLEVLHKPLDAGDLKHALIRLLA